MDHFFGRERWKINSWGMAPSVFKDPWCHWHSCPNPHFSGVHVSVTTPAPTMIKTIQTFCQFCRQSILFCFISLVTPETQFFSMVLLANGFLYSVNCLFISSVQILVTMFPLWIYIKSSYIENSENCFSSVFSFPLLKFCLIFSWS